MELKDILIIALILLVIFFYFKPEDTKEKVDIVVDKGKEMMSNFKIPNVPQENLSESGEAGNHT